jgi:hypothetical protein
MIGIEQPGASGDDSVAIDIGIVAKSDVELVFEPDQPCMA